MNRKVKSKNNHCLCPHFMKQKTRAVKDDLKH